jgi:hypothetical protein
MEKPETVIVGHGNSILDLKDEDIDKFDFVIRLKDCPAKVGKKTSVISSTSKHHHNRKDIEYWIFGPNHYGFKQGSYDNWMEYYKFFNPSYYKPSNGTAAAFLAKEFLGIDRITLAGFDMMKTGEPHKLGKERYQWIHDTEAEKKALDMLFEEVILI